MKKDAILMTMAGKEKLLKELNELETVKHAQAKNRIKHARSFCDFREDSEYEASLKNLAMIEDRIASIRYMLHHAEIIQETNGQIVAPGATVTIKEIPDGNLETYTIVGIEEADPFEGKISYIAPLAKNLIGTEVGDIIEVNTPSGKRKVKIIELT